jgi:tetratricopeptide (TPR) repeat protein
MKVIKSIVLLFFTGCVSVSFGQQRAIDSLQNVLKAYVAKDTVRVNLLNNIATKMHLTEPDKAIILLKESAMLSDDLHYENGKAYSLLFTGKAQINKNDYSVSLNYFQNALALYEVLKDKEGIANCYLNSGRAYYYLHDFPKALENLKRATTISEEAGKQKILSNAVMVMGMIYKAQGDSDKSLDHYKRAAAIDEKSGNKKGLSSVLLNLANLYKEQANYTLALESYNRSMEIKKQLGDDYSVACILNNIGTLYVEMENDKAALPYYQKALPILEKLKKSTDVLGCLSNIGVILMNENNPKALTIFKRALRLSEAANDVENSALFAANIGGYYCADKNYDESLRYFERAVKIQKQLGAERELSYSYLNMARAYYGKKDYEKALQVAKDGSDIAKKLDLLNFQRDFSLLLSQIYYSTKEYKLAYENRQTHTALNDSIYSKENIDKLAQIKYKYVYKKRENSLKDAVKTKDSQLEASQQQKMWWIVGSAFLLIVLGFVVALVKIRKVRMENKQLLTEQKLRRSQMNPHFIFNSIQNIRSLIYNKQEDEAVNYLNKFSKLTRQILESSNENYTSLAEEVELIKNYISIQQLAYGNAFNFNIDIDEEIDADSTFLPPMLTQPFIENAIKHGLNKKPENGKLEIRFYMKDAKLFFDVSDNGSGFDALKKPDEHKSMSMTITKQRLIHYTKNPNFEVHADNIFDNFKNIVGAKVSFEIPYIYEN